jgi:hypothetical protein
MIWPLVAYFAFVVVLVATILIVSYLLGQRHFEPATGEPYEGGIVSEGSARVRFSVNYYLVAMFFVVLIWKQSSCLPGRGGSRARLGRLFGGCAVRRGAGRGPHLSLEGRRPGLGAGTAALEVRI